MDRVRPSKLMLGIHPFSAVCALFPRSLFTMLLTVYLSSCSGDVDPWSAVAMSLSVAFTTSSGKD